MIADRTPLTTNNKNDDDEEGRKERRRAKKERNNCYRTYAALYIVLAVIVKMGNDQKADYEIKVFFDLISRRFFPLFLSNNARFDGIDTDLF